MDVLRLEGQGAQDKKRKKGQRQEPSGKCLRLAGRSQSASASPVARMDRLGLGERAAGVRRGRLSLQTSAVSFP